jgi:predicted RNA-binding Zn-ribbon protein involved in translation (DUF1610 family)
MASLLFNCPKTNQQVPTGIGTDVQSLRASWKTTVKVKCPHCGEVHVRSNHAQCRSSYLTTASAENAPNRPSRLRQTARKFPGPNFFCRSNNSGRSCVSAGPAAGRATVFPCPCVPRTPSLLIT